MMVPLDCEDPPGRLLLGGGRLIGHFMRLRGRAQQDLYLTSTKDRSRAHEGAGLQDRRRP
jgi:hypothetical protein